MDLQVQVKTKVAHAGAADPVKIEKIKKQHQEENVRLLHTYWRRVLNGTISFPHGFL